MVSSAQAKLVGSAIGGIAAYYLGVPDVVAAYFGVLGVALVDGVARGVNSWIAFRAAKAGLEFDPEAKPS